MAANWKEIGGVFAEALDVAPSLRIEFLDRRCAGNPDLRREVLRLLYLEGLNLATVAEAMGVSSSRISQLKQRSFARLRADAGLREVA